MNNRLINYVLCIMLTCVLECAGFQDLEVVDQMALLKSSFMELNVFRLAYRYVFSSPTFYCVVPWNFFMPKNRSTSGVIETTDYDVL